MKEVVSAQEKRLYSRADRFKVSQMNTQFSDIKEHPLPSERTLVPKLALLLQDDSAAKFREVLTKLEAANGEVSQDDQQRLIEEVKEGVRGANMRYLASFASIRTDKM